MECVNCKKAFSLKSSVMKSLFGEFRVDVRNGAYSFTIRMPDGERKKVRNQTF